MASRYDKNAKIDPELRGTVDFDFFESGDFENGVKKDDGGGDKANDKDYYYDDDDSFESDDEPEPVKKTPEKKAERNESPRRAGCASPERSVSPTPRAASNKAAAARGRSDRRGSDSSDSDITEVSPLGSRDVSPKNSNRQHNANKDKNVKIVANEEEDIDMDVLMQTIMKLEKDRAQQQKKNVMFIPPKERRDSEDRNYSFEKQKVEEIERENHRLLHKILGQHSRRKLSGGEYSVPPAVKRQYHSALNRQKEQRRIEQENMRILNRLQNVKPSKEVKRNELLRETQKQSMYGVPVVTMKTRRHSDSSNRAFDEMFEEGEWQGESQMSCLDKREDKKNRTVKDRPTSGRKKPDWNDRW